MSRKSLGKNFALLMTVGLVALFSISAYAADTCFESNVGINTNTVPTGCQLAVKEGASGAWIGFPDSNNNVLGTISSGQGYMAFGGTSYATPFTKIRSTWTDAIIVNYLDEVGVRANPISGYKFSVGGNGYVDSSGNWYSTCRREYKRDIEEYNSSNAWNINKELQPKFYQYKLSKNIHTLFDGREMDDAELNDYIINNPTSETVDEETGKNIIQRNSPETLVASTELRWLDEGSGAWHVGFLLDEVPEHLKDENGICALDIASHNTSVLKEAQLRIETLEAQVQALTQQVQALINK